ncbi:putative membrane protein [Lyngbya aestuarii BL J]|uniref:Putative membrane protein n=1 Tax=Lyngbya aestuarii BL J TaxID=1348334 RepID=U7QS07_9CYAN|nr:hypothetical protein [Lyngbya aestuarii]ERT09196.1 putative membrane protein [Lyngbya aestuarii BL J]
MNLPHSESQTAQQRLLEFAKQGNPKAIAMLLNRFKPSEDIITIIEDNANLKNNCLNIRVEYSQFPLNYPSKKYIYDALKILAIEYIEYVIIEPSIQTNPKKPCKERIDLTKELEKPEPEPPVSKQLKWPVWFPYPSSWIRMIVLILWLFIVIRIVAFGGVIIGGTVSVVSEDLMPFFQALGIGVIGSIFILTYFYHILSYIERVLFGKSSPSSFQWFPTPLSLWEGIYTPIVLLLSISIVVLVILPFIPWETCQTELLFEDTSCQNRIQNYLDSLEVIATIVWITSGLYLYQIESLIRTRVPFQKVLKFIALVFFSFMSTVLIYTTVTNWDYIYSAFANFENTLVSSELSENINATELPDVDVVNSPKIETEKPEVITPKVADENFKKGIENATNASELVQTANSKPEWEFVATQWQNAIDYMKQVQPDDSNYKAAQERVVQYQKNLEYARLAGSQAKE